MRRKPHAHRRRLATPEQLERRYLLAGDPLAEWRFDSSAGTALVDSIGTSAGTITGSSVYNATATALVNVLPVWTASNPTQWSTGTRNGALRLFSDTDGAIVDAAVAPQVQSVSLWFKADNTNPTRYNSSAGNGGSTSSTSVAMPLFETGSSAAGLNIYIYNNRLYVGAWNSGVAGFTNGTFLFTTSNAIVAGRWHHVVVTLDPAATLTAGALRGYLDGAEFAAGNGATIGGPASIGIGRTDGTTRFLLGTSGSSVVNNDSPAGNNHRGFAGYLDEARVYGETLTATDVSDIRAATAPTAPEEEWLVRDSGRAATIGRFRFAGQLASEHFVVKWGTGLPANMMPIGTYIQQNLNRLEMSWDVIVEEAGMAPPRARNGATYKVNVYVLDTGLWYVDSGGGTFSGAFAGGDPTGFAAMYVSPWAMGQSQSPRSINVAPWGDVANTTTMPHEFTHVLQAESGGFANSDFSGPFWETHANFGASLVADYDTGAGRAEVTTRNSINGRYGQRRHRYSLATDFRYEAHPFLNYLASLPEYGADFAMAALWSDADAQGNGKDPWQVLRNNFASAAEFASVYAAYVASSVTYKALHDGALLTGSPSIPAHNTTQRLFRAFLEPVASSPGWWQVPEQQTPEQYGANIIKLTPVGRTAGQPHTITVNLDGYVIPGQANGVYATLVAVSGSGAATQERFSPAWQSGEMTFELAAAETDVYLAVTAIPTFHRNYIWSQPFHGGSGISKIERFPYRVAMTGAVPVRSEDPVPRPSPGGGAVRHTNPDGSVGGWKTVAVPASVYIGPNAWVTGGSVSAFARIEDYATVVGGTVNGNATVRGNARVQGGTVTGTAIIDDYAVIAGGTISERARVRGDARVENGQVRGNALVMDYATIVNGSTVVAGDTVIKGYGVVDNAQMNGNALVMSSGLAAGTGLVTNLGVQYNGEPSAQETPLMTTQYNNLFARYDFAQGDNNVVWDTFNTTYGWSSATPPTWQGNSGDGFTGILNFATDGQFVEISPELSDLGDSTFATWVKWTGDGDANQRIWEFARDANNYMYLQPTSDGGGARFVIAVNGVERVLQAGTSLPINAWSHVAVAFNGETATLYVDASAKAVRTDVVIDPHQVRATYGLLGKGLATGGFRGAVDSLRVYSKGLSAAEVLGLVQLSRPGYSPEPGVSPSVDSDAILVLPFAVHDANSQLVLHGQIVTNGDLRNAAAASLKPAESASPGGMTSSGAQYVAYIASTEGIAGRPGVDGYAMSTVSGGVSFADAGSPLELALRTTDTFATVVRARRASDAGGFRFIAGRTSSTDEQGAWSLGLDADDHIVASMGGVDFDTGVVWTIGAWHEVGLSYDGAGAGDGTVRVYVDGRLAGSFQPGAIDDSSFFNLGSGIGGANAFRGWFDHVEFWDQPIDDATFAAFSGLSSSPFSGDYDGNGVVDGGDFLIWQRNIGSPAVPAGSGADGNRDGTVDALDLDVWSATFGSVPGEGDAAVAASVAGQASALSRPEFVGVAQAVGGLLDVDASARAATASSAAPTAALDVALAAARQTFAPLRRSIFDDADFEPTAEPESSPDADLDEATIAAAFESAGLSLALGT